MTIPKIIHQTWKSEHIPERWVRLRDTWKTFNPEWEYRFWTDEQGRDFVRREFAWLLPIYDNYPLAIMRADMLRYLLLAHFGGVYADMDCECLRPFDALIAGRDLLLGKEPEAHALMHKKNTDLDYLVCNACLASAPGHRFWDHVSKQLVAAKDCPGVLDATGPFFLTRAYQSYPERESIELLDENILFPATKEEIDAGTWTPAPNTFAVHHWHNTWAHYNFVTDPIKSVPVNVLVQRRILLQANLRFDVLRTIPRNGSRPSTVSCLMVTRGRVASARLAIDSFQRQTYPSRELVILDDSSERRLEAYVAELSDPLIRYVPMAQQGLSLGALRNLAAAQAAGEYIAQWDDDDLSHPQRLELQMAAIRLTGASGAFLQRELIWWPLRQRLAVSRPRVWESTIVCRRDELPEYPDLRRGEDTPVVSQLMDTSKLALVDHPILYIYIRHGANTFGEDHFERQWELADQQFEKAAYAAMTGTLEESYPLRAYAAFTDGAAEPPIANRASKLSASPNLRADALGSVLILTPVKDAGRHLPQYFDNLRKLTFPHKEISIAFLEGDSTDDTFEQLEAELPALEKEFRRVTLFRRTFGFHPKTERWAPEIQFKRRSVLAKSRNELVQRALIDEDWVLWLDVDVSTYPSDIIERLLSWGKEIIAPHCVDGAGGATFDHNSYQLVRDDVALHPSVHLAGTATPRGEGRLYLQDFRGEEIVPLDAVGGAMLLVKADLHRHGLNFPAFDYKDTIETEGFAAMARDMGIRCWGLPDLEIIHPRQ